VAPFDALDWRRFDVHAVVNGRGIAVIGPTQAGACRSWLERHGYSVEAWDFGTGVDRAVAYIGQRLRWEEQFGYALPANSRNLDALRDGFLSDSWHSDAFVLEIDGAETAWREAPEWCLSVLAIAQEHCLSELAMGRRFFVVLVLDESSQMIGKVLDVIRVPDPYRQTNPMDVFK
jgi:hypothetical protein